MIADGKKLSLIVFGVIYIVFGGMLVYTMFFMDGLSFDDKYVPETGLREVFFRNSSQRTINDVTISYIGPSGEKQVIRKILSVAPQEQVALDLDEFAGQGDILLVAEAPFHLTVERRIPMKASDTGITYNLRLPGAIISGSPLAFELEMCNDLDFKRDVTIEEGHREEFFSEQPITDSVSLEPNDCAIISYTLTPLKEGSTGIYFNVKVANNTE